MKLIHRFKIESDRLLLMPLQLDELFLYEQKNVALTERFGVYIDVNQVPDDTLIAVSKYVIPYLLNNPNQILYGTLWMIIKKDTKVIVGDLGFKGGPSDKGVIEIGYCIYPPYQRRGYMTEALKIISDWAFQQVKILIILAETDRMNIASQLTLKKNGFECFAETETAYWWRLDKEPFNLLA